MFGRIKRAMLAGLAAGVCLPAAVVCEVPDDWVFWEDERDCCDGWFDYDCGCDDGWDFDFDFDW